MRPALTAEQRQATPALDVRQAPVEDLGTVQSILAEAAAWLAAKGIDQWPAGFREATTLRRIRQGSVYLAYAADEPVATVTLDAWADPELWTGAADDAGYVHRLAVRRAWAGRGIGEALLDWAGEHVAASGGRWLRLDCMRDNQPLHDYSLRLGFEHVRTIELGHRLSGSLFQRAACSVRNGKEE
jgi:GNAT superfamily N-acetyltransferase